MAASAPLLTERDLKTFITDGLLVFPLDSVPDAVHARVSEQMRGPLLDYAEGMPGMGRPEGRDKIARVLGDEFEQIWGSAEVVAALNSVLGEDCWGEGPPSAPGHPHYKLSTIIGQAYHKDNSNGHQPREHTPSGALLMYYPQAVTIEMGPTKVLPGCVYLENNRENEIRGEDYLGPKWHLQYDDYEGRSRVEVNEFWHVAEEEAGGPARVDNEYESSLAELGSGPQRWVKPFTATVPAGSVVFMHQHMFHRATFSTAGVDVLPRFGFKRNFVRMRAPAAVAALPYLPSPGAEVDVFDEAEERLSSTLRPVWDHMWKCFYRQDASSSGSSSGSAQLSVAEAAARLSTESEEDERVGAAYQLAAYARAHQIPASLQQPNHQSASGDGAALAALVRALLESGAEAVERAGYRGLAAAGAAGVPALLTGLRHAQHNVRLYACFALGDAVEPGADTAVAEAAVAALAELLDEERHPRVLCQACKALGRVYSSVASGSAARAAVLPLLDAVLTSPPAPEAETKDIVARYVEEFPDEPLLQPDNFQELMTWFGRCGAFKDHHRSDRAPELMCPASCGNPHGSLWEIEFPEFMSPLRWEVEHNNWFGSVVGAARHSLLQVRSLRDPTAVI
jgi:hypothetical protein